jgi:DNA-binding MarR family transcriptional regulator
MKNDHVDHVLQQWSKERPDIDPSPMAVIGRLVRLSSIINNELQTVFTKYGLTIGEFDVLATLLRSGKPYALTPNRLFKALMLSSGAMTNRVDKLESKQLVKRQQDLNDRRSVIVSLTPKGLELINQAITDHVAKGHELLSCLSANEQENTARLLKKLLIEHHGSVNQFE